MDLRSARIAIFLVLGVSLTWSASDKSSGNGSSTVTLSRDIRNNPFLRPIPYLSAENNPFLQIPDKKNQQPTSGNSSTESNPFLHMSNNNINYPGNPFLYAPANKTESGKPKVDQMYENTFSTSVTSINSNNPFFISTNQRIDAETSDASTAAQASTHASEFTTSTLHASSPTTDSSHPLTFPIEAGPTTSTSPLLSSIQIGQKKMRSELKCDEYVREIAGVTEIVPLVGMSSRDVIKVDNECRNTNKLVLGGTEAKEGEFPHMVALGKYDSDKKFVLMCGGTLISHTWVLSAAHCTYGPNGSPSVARIGFQRLTGRKAGVTVSIKNMTRHPNYNPPAMYADIGLIELEETVNFTELIRPACLYQQYDTVPTSAWVSGWGVTEYAGDQTDRLQKAQLNLIDNLACTIQYDTVSSREIPYGVTPSMICAGDPHGGWIKDTCQGDSGGPLQVIHPRSLCLFQVVGITSFGQGCANANIPGVYTRVSHYIPWIENIVWPEN